MGPPSVVLLPSKCDRSFRAFQINQGIDASKCHYPSLPTDHFTTDVSDLYPISECPSLTALFLAPTGSRSLRSELKHEWEGLPVPATCTPFSFEAAEKSMDWFPDFVQPSLLANQPFGYVINPSRVAQSNGLIPQVKIMFTQGLLPSKMDSNNRD